MRESFICFLHLFLKLDNMSQNESDNALMDTKFMFKAMQQQFQRMNEQFNEIRERLDQNEERVGQIQQGVMVRDRRPNQQHFVPRDAPNYANDGDSEDFEEGDFRRGRNQRRERHRQHQPLNHGREGVDNNTGSIKLTIPPFEGKNDPNAFIEWERKVDLVFDCHNYSDEKKVKLAAVAFIDYAIVWWDQLVSSCRRNREAPILIAKK